LHPERNNRLLIPVLGTAIFVVLYIIATLLYPGGSQADKTATGFSWVHNYWCNLLNEYSINGQYNPAKPVALVAMLILCLTLAYFWLLFPRYILMGKITRFIIQLSGVSAMAISLLLFTAINHDLVTNLASLFGLPATLGTMLGLYKAKWYGLFLLGLGNLALVLLNNYLYYNEGLIRYLPVIQKVTFTAFLVWICSISIKIYGAARKQSRKEQL
jgi:hypothetical protein